MRAVYPIPYPSRHPDQSVLYLQLRLHHTGQEYVTAVAHTRTFQMISACVGWGVAGDVDAGSGRDAGGVGVVVQREDCVYAECCLKFARCRQRVNLTSSA